MKIHNNPCKNFYGFCHVIYFMYTCMHSMNDMFSFNPLIYLPILSICLSCSCDLTDLSRLSSNKTFFFNALSVPLSSLSCHRFSFTCRRWTLSGPLFTQYPFNTTTQPLLLVLFCLYLTSYTNLCILCYLWEYNIPIQNQTCILKIIDRCTWHFRYFVFPSILLLR